MQVSSLETCLEENMHFQLFCQTFLHLSKWNRQILNGRNGISPRQYN